MPVGKRELHKIAEVELISDSLFTPPEPGMGNSVLIGSVSGIPGLCLLCTVFIKLTPLVRNCRFKFIEDEQKSDQVTYNLS